jgi:proteasome lid subunit RPN8/RPN11
MMPERVVVHHEHLDAIRAHARFNWPNEACGLVAADPRGRLTMVYCLSNLDASPFRFTVDPSEHFGAWRHATGRGWEIAGSFHSHPDSAAAPSSTDISRALDPNWAYFIAGPVRHGIIEVRAYRIRGGEVVEIELMTGAR